MEQREYRSMDMTVVKGEEPSYMVEGYASTFDTYKVATIDGVDYYERVARNAFDDADLSDVVFKVDHKGPVYARTSNGAITLNIDDHGFAHRTDLGLTQRSRDLYEDIAVGNYPQMSFAFAVAEDHYERETRTRVIDRIRKVFDISAVDFPANPGTEINVSARTYFDGVIEAEEAERLRRLELERKRMATRIRISGGQK